MTEEQNRRYTPLKQAIDVLDEQLLNEIHAKQEQIAPVQEGSPGYLALNDQLIILACDQCEILE